MKLIVTTFVSTDGIMQAPGGPDEDTSGGFAQGGWMVPHFDDATLDLIADKVRAATALLLGRGTYDIFAAHWPPVSDADPFAAVLNRVPKYVVSTTLSAPTWRGTTVIAKDIVADIKALKAEPGGELQVHGSPRLIQTLVANDLVDEYRLWTAPVLLGHGKRPFSDATPPTALTLTDSLTTAKGVVYRAYRPTGSPDRGTYALDT